MFLLNLVKGFRKCNHATMLSSNPKMSKQQKIYTFSKPALGRMSFLFKAKNEKKLNFWGLKFC